MTTAATVTTLGALPTLVGSVLGPSGWVDVGQDRIDGFAAATDDHQWIHVDPERAATGPYGTTVAHGYLTLALVIPLWTALLDVTDAVTKINYGLDRVRFPAPVPAGSRVRLVATVVDVTAVAGGAQVVVDAVVEAEGQAKPACVARPVFRFS